MNDFIWDVWFLRMNAITERNCRNVQGENLFKSGTSRTEKWHKTNRVSLAVRQPLSGTFWTEIGGRHAGIQLSWPLYTPYGHIQRPDTGGYRQYRYLCLERLQEPIRQASNHDSGRGFPTAHLSA